MPLLLTLLIVATSPAAPMQVRYPQAAETFHNGFEIDADRNYDGWPDGWTRLRDAAHPHFVKVEIVKEPAAEGERALRADLDGGAAAVFGPPIEIDPLCSYVLEVSIQTDSLRHDEAHVTLAFLDARKQPLETYRSEGVGGTQGWRKIRIGPLASNGDRVRYASIGLHVEARSDAFGEADLKGSASFDDVWLGSLPRMVLETNQPHNLFPAGMRVELTCRVSGFAKSQPLLSFEVRDAMGRLVDNTEQAMTAASLAGGPLPETLRDQRHVQQSAAQQGVVPVRWTPKITAPGFYSARVTMQEAGRLILERSATLAVIEPLSGASGGEFGWALPHGVKPMTAGEMPVLLSQCGVSWVKFPLWYGEHDIERREATARFVDRLNAEQIDIVGLLHDPPKELRDKFGERERGSLRAADIFTPGPEVWYPSLEPVLARLSSNVRWWQLGLDDDDSFAGYPDLSGKMTQIRQQLNRIGQDAKLGMPWRWIDELPPEKRPAWQFVSLQADPPLTARELTAALSHPAKEAGVERWVVLQPLSRKQYDPQVRVTDFVQRLVAAKMHGVNRISVPDPFDEDDGLLNPDGTPGELLPPWLATVRTLSGATFLGSLQMERGSENRLFLRGAEAVLVVWNQSQPQESLYLGDQAELLDVWGKRQLLAREGERQTIPAGPTPAFVTGISPAVARTCLSFTLQREQLPSLLGQSLTNAYRLKNHFPRGVRGRIRTVAPAGWQIVPPVTEFKLAAGEEGDIPFAIRLPFDANSGPQTVRFDLEIATDREHRFSVFRQVQVGLGDIVLEATSKLAENGELVVEQRLQNNTDQEVSFKCDLYATNRRRMRAQVFRLGRGEDLQTYRLPDGKQLLGQMLWIRAEEVNGERVLSHRLRVEE